MTTLKDIMLICYRGWIFAENYTIDELMHEIAIDYCEKGAI